MTSPIVTSSQLRANFPAFANRTRFPDSMVNFWIGVAAGFVSIAAWGPQWGLGVQLFACHNLVLERQSMDTAANGGAPGVSTGPVASKSVDKVSINYASAEALDSNASHWNLTIYGTRYIRFAKTVGVGPLQVNGPLVGDINGQFVFFGVGPYQPQW